MVRLDAQNDQERIEADLLIKRLEGAQAIAAIEAQDRNQDRPAADRRAPTGPGGRPFFSSA